MFIAAENGITKVEAVSGFCDANCQNFIYFIILFSFLVFIHSTSEVGSMLLVMRCTDPKGVYYHQLIIYVELMILTYPLNLSLI